MTNHDSAIKCGKLLLDTYYISKRTPPAHEQPEGKKNAALDG
jgi:hypothetical protein